MGFFFLTQKTKTKKNTDINLVLAGKLELLPIFGRRIDLFKLKVMYSVQK